MTERTACSAIWLMPYDRRMEEPEEVVDGVPVLRDEGAEVPATRPSAGPVAVQAAAVAGASFVAGAGIVALVKGRRARKSTFKLGRGRKAQKLEIVGSRSFLVDVHVLDRR
jgi:hypothetical protein